MTINWKPFIPLAGGFPLGVARILGTPDSYASYDDFAGSDAYYSRYTGVQRNDDLRDLDLVVATAPCAGLSTNSVAPLEGDTSHRDSKNRFILETAQSSVDAGVKLLIGETVPMFGSQNPLSMGVRNSLSMIASQAGYDFGFIRVTSADYGLPQNRRRIFYYVGQPEVTEHLREKHVKGTYSHHYTPPIVESVSSFQDFIETAPRRSDEHAESRIETLTDSYRAAIEVILDGIRKGDINESFNLDKARTYTLTKLVLAMPREYGDAVSLLDPKIAREIAKFRAKPNSYGNLFALSGTRPGATICRSRYMTNQEWYRMDPQTVEFLSVGNIADLMGMPTDYALPKPKDFNLLCQNVCPSTAEGVTRYMAKALL